ncbi:hypothetical protein CVT24_006965 [Panaeolus cyanescens]|uniref:Uncharacterized protein n=1 Tax=Panaeolus cyanescens TaxID=181874 RepID=A0A409YX48_9AGAR|nr:hypothetical protein CVT24_006965 [Panaeolus cyanescens]
MTSGAVLQLDQDWSNWEVYKVVTLARLYSQGLAGNVHRDVNPGAIIYHNKNWYHTSDSSCSKPLEPHLAQHYRNEMDKYLKNEGTGTLILFETLPLFVFEQISSLNSLKQKWSTLETISAGIKQAWHTEVGLERPISSRLIEKSNVQQKLLYKLQTMKYMDGPLIEHIHKMIDMRAKLASYDIEITSTGMADILRASVLGSDLEVEWPASTLQTLRDDNDRVQQAKEKAEEEVKKIKQTLYEREMEIKELNYKLTASEARIEALEEELKAERKKREELEQELAQI